MSETIYRWLLKLYPKRFREEYGAAAMQLFRDRLREERGVLGRLRFWVDVIADLAVSIPREHRRRQGEAGAYRLSEEAVAELVKRSIIAPATFFAVFLMLGFAAGWFGESERVFLFAAYLPLAAIGARRLLHIRASREIWRSYELSLEPDRILQKNRVRSLALHRNEVFKINESQYGLLISGESGGRGITIQIPACLNGYPQVRERLSEWMPIAQRRALWLSNPLPVRACVWSLFPAMLLVHSIRWFLILAVLYYGTILLEILMNLARPPRNSGLDRWVLPQPSYMWQRFRAQWRRRWWWILYALTTLPIGKALVEFR